MEEVGCTFFFSKSCFSSWTTPSVSAEWFASFFISGNGGGVLPFFFFFII